MTAEIKKVYAVTNGSYSNYTIRACFTSEKLALEWIGDFSEDYNIEEYVLDDMSEKRRVFYRVVIAIFDSTVISCFKNDDGPSRIFVHVNPLRFNITVETDSEERAIKVASEKRAHLIAYHNKFKVYDMFDYNTLQKIE